MVRNNEIESARDHWGDFQKETPYLRADYIRLFEEVLQKAVQEADGETFTGILPRHPAAVLTIRMMQTAEKILRSSSKVKLLTVFAHGKD